MKKVKSSTAVHQNLMRERFWRYVLSITSRIKEKLNSVFQKRWKDCRSFFYTLGVCNIMMKNECYKTVTMATKQTEHHTT